MTSIILEINGTEYFPITHCSLSHSLVKSIGLKSATVTGVAGKNFKNFLIQLNNQKLMLCALYVDGKLFLEGYINDKLIHYKDAANFGTEINIRLLDRFIGLVESDLIFSRPKGTLQSFVGNALTELGYASPAFIKSYRRSIKNVYDFMAAGEGIDISAGLKTFSRNTLVEEQASNLIGESLSINKAILISNGYDQITFQRPNLKGESVFHFFRDDPLNGGNSNINSIDKYGEMGDSSPTPSVVITLNSHTKTAGSDSNSSVVSPNIYGIPHIIRVSRVNTEASYQDISGMMNFAFAGIKARSNSYIVRAGNVNFDSQKQFFEPNKTINLYDEKYGIDSDMIIMDMRLDIDAKSGSELVINVCPPESFEDNVSIKQKGKLSK